MTPERRAQLVRSAESCESVDELAAFRAVLSEHRELGDAEVLRAIRDQDARLQRRESRR